MSKKTHITANVVLAVLPVGLALALLVLTHAKGPHWLEPDPDYAYYLSSVSLAEFRTPGYPDHPGMAVKYLAALTMRAAHMLAGEGGFANDALVRPEFYVKRISEVFIIVACGLLFIAGRQLYRVFDSVLLGMLGQSACLLVFGQLQYSLCKMNAEAVLFSLSLGMASLSVCILYQQQVGVRVYAVLFGIVSALGLFTKLNFLPVVLLPVLLLRGIRTRLVYGMAFAAASLLPALTLGADRVVFFGQLRRYFISTGVHAQHGRGMIPPNVEVIVRDFIRAEPYFFAVGALAVVACVAGVARYLVLSKRISRDDTCVLRTLAGMTAVLLMQFVAVVRSPLAYYFTPVFGLLIFMLPAAVWLLVPRTRPWAFKVVVLVLLGVVWMSAGVRAATMYGKIYKEHLRRNNEARAVIQLSHVVPAQAISVYDKSVTLPYTALHFGNDSCGRRHSERLERLYPHAFFYHPWSGTYHTWDKVIRFKDMWLQNQDVYLVGGTNYSATMTGGMRAPREPLTLVTSVAYAACYRIETNLFGTGVVKVVPGTAHAIMRWIDGWFVNTQLEHFAECTNILARCVHNAPEWCAIRTGLLAYGEAAAAAVAFMDWYSATNPAERAHALAAMQASVSHQTWPYYMFALHASPPEVARAHLISPDVLVTGVFSAVPLWDSALVGFAKMYQEHQGPEAVIAYWDAIALQWPNLRGAATVNSLAVFQQLGDSERGLALLRANLKDVRAAQWTIDRAKAYLERIDAPEAKILYNSLSTPIKE